MGGIAREIDFAPWRAVAAMLYEGPHVAERHAAIRAFFDAQPDALDPTVRGIVAGARGYSATDAFVAEGRLAEMKAALAPLWRNVDVLVVPTAPTIYTIAEVEAEPLELNRRLGTYTNFVNLLDLAAMAVPAAIRDDGAAFRRDADRARRQRPDARRSRRSASTSARACRSARPARRCRRPNRCCRSADVARVAAVGAHLSGLPLNGELTERGARLVGPAKTAPRYRLFALPGTTPPKPGMVRAEADPGHAIDVEIWEVPLPAFGAFVAGIPAPLSIGTIELDDGSSRAGIPVRSRRHRRRRGHLALRRLAQLSRRARRRELRTGVRRHEAHRPVTPQPLRRRSR